MRVRCGAAALLAGILASHAAGSDAQPSEPPGSTFESLRALPDWSGWWEYRGELPSAMLARNPPPLAPGDLAALRAARANPEADADPLRFCRPPQFLGESGNLVVNLEVLFTPGRVTIVNEGGLVRRIYTDGRSLPADPDATNTGVSVGRWEGDALVVETIGIDPRITFPVGLPGGVPVGQNVRITERIALTDTNTLVFDVTLEAPDILTAPDRRRIPFARSAQTAARESTPCTRFDRSLDPTTGRQRFDLTPPLDLPPPPR
jgi:hypothetical protein